MIVLSLYLFLIKNYVFFTIFNVLNDFAPPYTHKTLLINILQVCPCNNNHRDKKVIH